MKIKENVTLYFCEHCGRRYVLKHACEKHENVCTRNPENIPICYRCEYFDVKQCIFESGYDYVGHKYRSMYCNKLEEEMRPITSFKKGNSILGQTPPDMVTPKNCDHFSLRTTV